MFPIPFGISFDSNVIIMGKLSFFRESMESGFKEERLCATLGTNPHNVVFVRKLVLTGYQRQGHTYTTVICHHSLMTLSLTWAQGNCWHQRLEGQHIFVCEPNATPLSNHNSLSFFYRCSNHLNISGQEHRWKHGAIVRVKMHLKIIYHT